MYSAVIIVAAGFGKRFGGKLPKQYTSLNGIPVLAHSINRFAKLDLINAIQVVIAQNHEQHYRDALKYLNQGGLSKKLLKVCYGGKERSESVKAGLLALAKLDAKPKKVLIHDAARPLVSEDIITAVLRQIRKKNAVLPCLPMVDAVWKFKNNSYKMFVNRKEMLRAQTPQGFDFNTILKAHLENKDKLALDDILIAQKCGAKITQVSGSEENFKITTLEDLNRAEILI